MSVTGPLLLAMCAALAMPVAAAALDPPPPSSAAVAPAPAIPPAAVEAYTFSDRRPAKQLKSGFESLMITNCAYGSQRAGDNDLDADLAALLRAMLDRRFGARLAGRTVVLQGFTVHFNNAAGLRHQVGNQFGGLIPALMNRREKVGCAPTDLRGGYVLGEIEPVGAMPMVVAIDVRIGDEAFYARSIAPAVLTDVSTKPASQSKWAAWNRPIDALVQTALAQLGDQIEQRSFAQPVVAPAAGAPADPPPPL